MRNTFTTKAGSLNLTWPRYKVCDGVYAEQTFSIINTCSVDTGLFILYHAYKAGTEKFRNLFETDVLDAFISFRRTFQYVDNDNWTTARLYWLVRHELLDKQDGENVYDLLNTMTHVVFNFVRPAQTFEINLECRCVACPKRRRQYLSSNITLR